MAPPPNKRPSDSAMRSAAMLVAIPTLLIVSPLVGFFLGDLADGKFHTSPWLGILGLVLGFVAAGREVWFIYRRYLDSQER